MGHDFSTTKKKHNGSRFFDIDKKESTGSLPLWLEKKTQRMIPLKGNPSRSHISTFDSGIYFTKKLSISFSCKLFSARLGGLQKILEMTIIFLLKIYSERVP